MAISKSPLAGDPAHLRAAFADLGLAEKLGKPSHNRILELFRLSGNPGNWDDSETAWCAAAAGAWLAEAGIKGTGKLNARSYLEWGTPTDAPKRGDLVIFKRGTSEWQGHVAFYLGRDGGRIWVIGGNQSNAVTVASYPAADLLGYRRPPAASVPVEPKEAPMAAPKPTILKRGSTGARVMALQSDLRAIGFNAGPIDGEFGPETDKAVRAFQESMGLEADGEVGPHTSAALEEMLAKRIQQRAQPQEYRPDSVTPIGTARQPAQETAKAPAAPDAPRSGSALVAVILVVLVAVAAGAALLIWGV